MSAACRSAARLPLRVRSSRFAHHRSPLDLRPFPAVLSTRVPVYPSSRPSRFARPTCASRVLPSFRELPALSPIVPRPLRASRSPVPIPLLFPFPLRLSVVSAPQILSRILLNTLPGSRHSDSITTVILSVHRATGSHSRSHSTLQTTLSLGFLLVSLCTPLHHKLVSRPRKNKLSLSFLAFKILTDFF